MKKILVVEDDHRARKLLVNVLKKSGFNVEEAENGFVALNKMLEAYHNNDSFDVVTLDLMMPVMNGLTFLKVIRHQKKIKDTPVFITTARKEKEIFEKLNEYGMQGYFLKPYKIKELIEKINLFIEENRKKEAV